MTPEPLPELPKRLSPAVSDESEGLQILARIIAKAVIKHAQTTHGEAQRVLAGAEVQGHSCSQSSRRKDVGGTQMKTDEQFDLKKETDHWTSYLLASIAEGNFRDGVSRMIQHFHDKETRKLTPRQEGPITDERLTLSIKEAANILRISSNTAYSLANQGKLPVMRVGRRILVPRKGLNELLSKGWTV